MMSPSKDTLQVIDKRTLEKVVAEIRTEPGKTLAHVEFTRDGKLRAGQPVGAQGRRRALIVFDAADLQGSQAHPDGQAGRQVQPVQQDHGTYGFHTVSAQSRSTLCSHCRALGATALNTIFRCCARGSRGNG
jgi:hypothetical protein